MNAPTLPGLRTTDYRSGVCARQRHAHRIAVGDFEQHPTERVAAVVALAGGGGGDAGDQSSRDAEAVVEAIMHARERYESHTGAALTVGQSRRRP